MDLALLIAILNSVIILIIGLVQAFARPKVAKSQDELNHKDGELKSSQTAQHLVESADKLVERMQNEIEDLRKNVDDLKAENAELRADRDMIKTKLSEAENRIKVLEESKKE